MAREFENLELVLAISLRLGAADASNFQGDYFVYSPYVLNQLVYGEDSEYLMFDKYIDEGLVNNAYVEFYKSSTSDELLGKKKWPKGSGKEVIDYINKSFEKYEDGGVLVFLKIDKKKLDKFIEDYLKDWQQGNFYSESKNLYKPSKQLKVVVSKLLTELEEYSDKHFLFRPKFDGVVDSLGVVLFLEKRGFIKIVEVKDSGNGLDSVNNRLAIRIDVSKGFYESFSNEFDDLEYYDFVINKDKFLRRIIYQSPRKLVYDSKKHEVNSGGVPSLLLEKASVNHGEVDLRELIRDSGESEDKVLKALNNFRRSLRSKFGFSDDEAFVVKRGDKLLFDMDLFYFLPKKAQISH